MNEAFCSNDVSGISGFLSADWKMVEGTQGVVSKQSFLEAIAAGRLIHQQMKKEIVHMQMRGQNVLLVTKGKNVGSYDGHPFNAECLVSHLLYQTDAGWQCVFTQETPVSHWPEPKHHACV